MDNEVHIRSHTTARYLHASGGWTALRIHARKFATISHARDWCVQERLVNIEIVVVRDALLCLTVPFETST
jgi:hypothetical protein